MKILAINCRSLDDTSLTHIGLDELATTKIDGFDYILISGGDGTFRRSIQQLLKKSTALPSIIFDAQGSFNMIQKIYKLPNASDLLEQIKKGKTPTLLKVPYYSFGDEIFFFSAGNGNDLLHIFFSEQLRVGVLKRGVLKYLIALIVLLPAHLVLLPLLILSKEKFFLFKPLPFRWRIGNLYSYIPKRFTITNPNGYSIVELDGDLVPFAQDDVVVEQKGVITLATLPSSYKSASPVHRHE